jgi:GTPase SAR1 family protein
VPQLPTTQVVVIGEAGAGKTCLINSYVGLPFDAKQKPTLGTRR